MRTSHVYLLALVILCWIALVHSTFQDLTHVMDPDTLTYHPIIADEKYHFKLRIDHVGPLGGIDFVSWNSYSTVEHLGTHFDAPYHYYEQGKQSHQIPFEDLHGPLVLIDIRDKATDNKLATVDVADLEAWEAKHGKIPDRAYVLMLSGWSKYWGDQFAYIGTNTSEGSDKMAWPAFHVDAARWLVDNRTILGIGVDTVSCDLPRISVVHNVISPANKICVENLNNLNKVPASGADFFHMPMIIKGGTGGQVRAYASWGTDKECHSGSFGLKGNLLFFLFLFRIILI